MAAEYISKEWMMRQSNPVVRLVAKETERQLRQAAIRWMRYGKGREQLEELQARYAQYNGEIHTEFLYGPKRQAIAA